MRRALVATFASFALAFAACGGDDDASTPTATRAASSTPASSPTAPPVPDVVRTVADAVRRRDVAALQQFVQYDPVPCTTAPPAGPGGPPLCRPGEADGTPVDVVQLASCESFYARPDEAHPELFELDAAAPFAGAYRLPDDSQVIRVWPAAEYAVLGERPRQPDVVLLVQYLVDDRGIVGIENVCGGFSDVAQFVRESHYGAPVIAP